MGAPGAIPEHEKACGPHFQRKIVSLAEQGAPDIANYLGLSEKKQTIDKLDVLRTFHAHCLELLGVFTTLAIRPDDFVARKHDIFRSLNNKLLKSYLNNYGFTNISTKIRNIMNWVEELLDLRDFTFGQKFHQLILYTNSETETVKGRYDFFSRRAYIPFLQTVQEVIKQIDTHSFDRFKCSLKPRRSAPNVVERRYKLHEANYIVRVNIPLINEGPGIAEDVTALLVSENEDIFPTGSPLDIGAVPPGEFTLSFDMLVGEPCSEVRLLIDISWRTARGAEKQNLTFDALLSAQDPNVDWDALEANDPYSTEVAHGDEFVGRRKKVMALVNRLRKQQMQSSYITGQKRVGKTSLALAVADLVS